MHATTTRLARPLAPGSHRERGTRASWSELPARLLDGVLDVSVWGVLALIERAEARFTRGSERDE